MHVELDQRRPDHLRLRSDRARLAAPGRLMANFDLDFVSALGM
ncbi:hypothetical protein OV203_20280 [Nannocystis sp. ILAH1]|nr:hypothetical protein [Nannocystis sp. ILAH1]MCY0989489.1 hypothetical protein [Nannocystis sp. ILAH1]